MFKYTIINEDGTTEDWKPASRSRKPTLEELQGIVKGYVAVALDYPNRLKIWVNEEGAINGMKLNPKAQEICSASWVGYTVKFPNGGEGLYGPVLIRETIYIPKVK